MRRFYGVAAVAALSAACAFGLVLWIGWDVAAGHRVEFAYKQFSRHPGLHLLFGTLAFASLVSLAFLCRDAYRWLSRHVLSRLRPGQGPAR